MGMADQGRKLSWANRRIRELETENEFQKSRCPLRQEPTAEGRYRLMAAV